MPTTMWSVIVPERSDENIIEGMQPVWDKQLTSLNKLLCDWLYILLYRHDGTDRSYLYQIPTRDELEDVLRQFSWSEFFVPQRACDNM